MSIIGPVSDTELEDALADAARNPDDVEARIRAAYALDGAGHESAAVTHYDAAWALGVPADRRQRFVVGYGSTLRNVGRLEQSVALLAEASAADPDYAPAYAGLADSYASLRSIKQAAAKPIEVLTPQQVGIAEGEWGEAGSASRVRRMYVPEKSRAQMIEGSVEEQAARLAQLIKERRGGAA